MNVTPVVNKINPCIQNLQKEGRVFVQSLTNTPTYKMGGWTMRGYGMPQEIRPAGTILSRLGEFAKPLSSINFFG